MENSFHAKDKKALKSELSEFYIEFDKSLVLPKKTKFGYEIEFKIPGYKASFIDFLTNNLNDDISELSNYISSFLKSIGYKFPWYATYELNEHLEIISPVLEGNKSDWEMLENILDFLNKKEAYYSGSCGAHIHIEKSILNNDKESWINFLKLWYLFEDTIIKFSNGEKYFERKNFSTSSKRCKGEVIKLINGFDDNNYTIPKPLRDKNSSLMLERKTVGELLEKIIDINNVKDTIEFRCPNGTLNKTIWQNNTRFFINLLNSVSNSDFDYELINYYMDDNNRKIDFNQNKELYLADFIFNNEFDKLCFLRQYYKDFNEPSKYSPYAISTPFWK